MDRRCWIISACSLLARRESPGRLFQRNVRGVGSGNLRGKPLSVGQRYHECGNLPFGLMDLPASFVGLDCGRHCNSLFLNLERTHLLHLAEGGPRSTARDARQSQTAIHVVELSENQLGESTEGFVLQCQLLRPRGADSPTGSPVSTYLLAWWRVSLCRLSPPAECCY